jgi:hypothetical protein
MISEKIIIINFSIINSLIEEYDDEYGDSATSYNSVLEFIKREFNIQISIDEFELAIDIINQSYSMENFIKKYSSGGILMINKVISTECRKSYLKEIELLLRAKLNEISNI